MNQKDPTTATTQDNTDGCFKRTIRNQDTTIYFLEKKYMDPNFILF